MSEAAIPFTPPHVSINRVEIVDLPGLKIDDRVRGRRAYDLLSTRALINYARQEAAALELPDVFLRDGTQTRIELPPYISQSLRSGSKARAAAQAIGRQLGRNLGHILLTLHRGDPINRAARKDWTEADWRQWQRIRKVWLGGGLVSGPLGELIIRHSREFLADTGYASSIEIGLSPFGQAMALLGASRYLPATTRCAVCLDLGQTQVKRARVMLRNGALSSVHLFPPRAVDWDWLGVPSSQHLHHGERVSDYVTAVLKQTISDCRGEGLIPDREIMLSVAAYVRGGQLLGNGIYAQMHALAEDIRPFLSAQIRAHEGMEVSIRPIHDGTAAATLHAGEQNSAVVMIGTALGVGFPPPATAGLRPVPRSVEVNHP